MDSEFEKQSTDPGQYVVVARRYRPKDFTDLVGQDQVSTALANAINTNRVGHAYLFTGARGVGKTSTARILAKCLNCVEGPTPNPCGVCDNCQSIATGDDVDVLEIDGASNRGIDEIRQLRSNVNIRPSRSRHKIYIIDEVHMLTTQAFNALLKTLEEPPEHVKFIFCTTDPEKIPITVISRCQRFDFTGIQLDSIVGRLQHIVESEKVNVTDDALELLARRAGGSMRDSQSLLEQLLSFGGEQITINDVHALLGTADSGRIWQLLRCIQKNDAAGALQELDATLAQGADAGQVIEQLSGCYRDIMAKLVGCSDEMLLNVGGDGLEQLREAVADVSLENVLAAIQILDDSMLRMRQSTQARLIAESAIVRSCNLEKLESLAAIVGQLRAGASIEASNQNSTAPRQRSAEKKTAAVNNSSPRVDEAHKMSEQSHVPTSETGVRPQTPALRDAPASKPVGTKKVAFATENLPKIWRMVVEQLEGLTHSHASRCQSHAISAPNRLAIRFPATYTSSRAYCERPSAREEIEAALANVVGQTVKIEIEAIAASKNAPQTAAPKLSQTQLRKQVMSNPLVQTVAEMFDGAVVNVEPPKSKGTTDE